MSSRTIFIRQVRSRSQEHQKAMQLLATDSLAGQMVAVLRQELDSMVRVIYLLTQVADRQELLMEASVKGEKWSKEGSRAMVTDKEMVHLAQNLTGWAQSVYKFGCAFIHLSNLHDYNDREPLAQLPEEERNEILRYCHYYHAGPEEKIVTFSDLIPFLPKVLEKISDNLEGYIEDLEKGKTLSAHDIW